MAGRNFITGPRGGFYEAVPEAEVAPRTEKVRRAKAAVGGRELTPLELDAILPPVECAITRNRLRRATRV